MSRGVLPAEQSQLWHALEAAEAAAPVDAVDAVTSELAVALGTDRITLLIADLAGGALVRLTHGAGEDRIAGRRDGDDVATEVLFSSGRVERTLRDQRPTVEHDGADWRVLAPVTQRGEVMGLLEVVLSGRPDGAIITFIGRAARMLAYVLIANGRHTDLFEWGRRSTPFTLSAELQRRLLPDSSTCEALEFTLSACLEPAATVGGDTFDYSVGRDLLHLSVTDAMGHGVAAALTASIAVGALRNGRRRGDALLDVVAAAGVAVSTWCPGSFCSGLIGQIELATGVLTVVNAGHVPPILLRNGKARELLFAIDLPLGIDSGTTYRLNRVALQAGDRLAVVTDGMSQRSAGQVGLQVLLEQDAFRHPREAARRMADGVSGATPCELLDDATVVLVDWHGRDVTR